MDKISAMKTFVQIVDKGSLTNAAEVLATSLPTVVRILALLEQSLGVRLLNRTTRRIALTEEGQRYLISCRQILSDIDDAEQSLTAQKPQGKLVVTAPVLFGQMHVAPAVTKFISDNDRIQVSLLLSDNPINLIEDGVDIAIRIGHLTDSSLIAIPVGSIRQIVCASPSYLNQINEVTKPEQITALNCVHLSALNNNLHWPFTSKGNTFQVPISSSFQCNHAVAAVNACVAGVGLGMFFSYQVAPFIKSKHLIRILKDYEPSSIPVNIIYPHAKLLSTRIRMFIDSMTIQLRETLQSIDS